LLVVVDEDGCPAIRGGKPDGFALRSSLAGQLGAAAQVAMNHAAVVAETRRYYKSRGLGDEQIEAVVKTIPTPAALLGRVEAPKVQAAGSGH
jgi:hypothetical protein